jgi:hypothetical protein
MVQEIASTRLENFSPTYEAITDNFGSVPALQRVQKVILKQCKKALKMA